MGELNIVRNAECEVRSDSFVAGYRLSYPKGIAASSPGLAASAYPGENGKYKPNPKGVAARVLQVKPTSTIP